ncbi:MAG: YkgJ family cysteine cluster protein [Dehalococcoidales bacterium]|nr:YkgJ family cysteine cluster protein [Dehalococcoidales bacterium]
MDNIDYQAEEIFTLDLDGYGLSHLKGKDLLTLDEDDFNKLIAALGNDDISLNVPIPCKPDDIFELISSSECRKCGKCCQPNPLNPDSPGIEVFKEELETLSEVLHVPYQSMESQTKMGKWVPHPFGWTNLSSTRWLPLPCPFYDEETRQCQVHSARPVVCKIHPVIFTGELDSVSIKLNCDYGKDLVKTACKIAKKNDPGLEIIL